METTSNGKSKMSEFGEQISTRAKAAAADLRANIEDTYGKTKVKVVDASKATDDYVRDNPWTVVGIAAGVGFLLGLLIGRK